MFALLCRIRIDCVQSRSPVAVPTLAFLCQMSLFECQMSLFECQISLLGVKGGFVVSSRI